MYWNAVCRICQVLQYGTSAKLWLRSSEVLEDVSRGRVQKGAEAHLRGKVELEE